MDDAGIIQQISALVEREHHLRTAREEGAAGAEDERRELGEIEAALDRCWDLLRQRRAKREFGEDADEATVRPAGVVENYLS
jgi:hypothetical protein